MSGFNYTQMLYELMAKLHPLESEVVELTHMLQGHEKFVKQCQTDVAEWEGDVYAGIDPVKRAEERARRKQSLEGAKANVDLLNCAIAEAEAAVSAAKGK